MISALVATLLLLDQILSAGFAFTSSGLAALALAFVVLGSEPRVWQHRTILANVSILTVSLIALGAAGAAVAGCGEQFYFMTMSACFAAILGLATFSYARAIRKGPLIGPAASRWAVVFVTAMLVIAALGFDLYGTVAGAPTNRAAGLFAEPSHLALYGFVAWGYAWLYKPNRPLVVISLALAFYYAFSLTLVLVLLAWVGFATAFRLVRPVTLAATVSAIAVPALLATQLSSVFVDGPLGNVARYVDSRIVGLLAPEQSDAPNLSSIVLLRGVDLAHSSAVHSSGLGLGIGNMGCSAAVNESSEYTAILSAYGLQELNLRDGSTLGAKLVAELGFAGAAMLLGFLVVCTALLMRLRGRQNKQEAAVACALMATLLFVRALPYFAIPTLIAVFVLARSWALQKNPDVANEIQPTPGLP